MDIKKFISSTTFDNDYNKIIRLEHEAIKNRCRNNNKSGIEKTKCLYRVSDCNFFTIATQISDIIKDQHIKEFEAMCKDDIDKKYCLAYSGSMVKKYFDPNYQYNQYNQQHDVQYQYDTKKKVCIENCYVVTL